MVLNVHHCTTLFSSLKTHTPRAHTHKHTNTANRGSAVVAGLASGSQKRGNGRFEWHRCCQDSTRCCPHSTRCSHHSTACCSQPRQEAGAKTLATSSPALTAMRERVADAGMKPTLRSAQISSQQRFMSTPLLCICAARLSGKTRIGNYVASVLTLVPDKRGVPWSKLDWCAMLFCPWHP